MADKKSLEQRIKELQAKKDRMESVAAARKTLEDAREKLKKLTSRKK